MSTGASRRPRARIMALCVIVLGVATSLAAWHRMSVLEREVARTGFETAASERQVAIEGKFDIALETLESLASFFRSSDDVSRDGFRLFTTPILDRHAYIQGFGWNQRISLRRRDDHERASRMDGYPHYQITERNDAGEMIRARDREEYVAVSYLEPLKGNERALGYDIASEAARGEALARARTTGRLSITAPLRLVQDERTHPHGFLACIPIRQEGYVVGVFRAGDIVQSALEGFQPVGLAIELVDAAAPVRNRLFGQALAEAASDSSLVHEAALGYGGRTWTLRIMPTAAYMAEHQTPWPFAALIAGLLITGLAAAFLLMLAGRSARVAALVDERTEELSEANAELAEEVTQRLRAEDALRDHRDQLEDVVQAKTNDLVRALSDLSESDERHRLTLEAIADGAWDWNMVTDGCRYSEKWLASLGYAPEDAQPHLDFLESIVHPDDLEGARAALIPHADGRMPRYEFRSRVRRKDGTYGWNLSRGRIVAWDDDGNPTRMLGTNTDVTEQVDAELRERAMEQRLQHSQKLESLGVLAGGIAHDFNNLLVPMMGGAEIAIQSVPEGSPATKPLQHILLAATRASELTEQMLAYAGRNSQSFEPIELRRLVEEMVELLRASISKKAKLLFEFEDGTLPIEGDLTQVRQIVMNLITNASDALADEPGQITVRIGTMSAAADDLAGIVLGDSLAPGRYVFFEVLDTGCGMDPETAMKVFDPFFTTKFQGRGLGLAAVLGIMRTHRGGIRVQSVLGTGTAMRVLFPAGEATPRAARDAAAAALRERGTGTVLIIDDEPAVRRVAAAMLESAGFDVITAADGIEGIERFHEHRAAIVLVVLDMTMPRMSGVETIRELQRIDAEVRVVFTSGYSETQASEAVTKLGAAGFLKKPYRMHKFLAGVWAALRT